MSGDLALPALGKFPPHSILVIVWPFRFQFQSAEMPPSIKLSVICSLGWLGSRVFIVLDSGLRRRRARVQIAVATLSGNSLRQTVHTHRASVHQAAKLVAALLRVAGVTAGLAEIMAAYRGVYDSRHLQADCKEPESAPEPCAR